jgi:hypothetical protein
VHDNLGTIVGAGIDTFWFAELPAAVQVMVAIRLVGLPDEFTEERSHSTATRIKDPSGQTVSEAVGEFTVSAEGARPDFLTGVTIPAAVRFEVNQEGAYAVEYEFGGSEQTIPIHVVVGSP